MNLASKMHQTLTRWTVTPNGFGGYNFGSPEPLACRWEDKSVLFRDPQGVERVSNAVIYTAVDLSVEDYVFLGTSVAADPTTLDSFQVKQFNKVPDLRNTVMVRKAFL